MPRTRGMISIATIMPDGAGITARPCGPHRNCSLENKTFVMRTALP